MPHHPDSLRMTDVFTTVMSEGHGQGDEDVLDSLVTHDFVLHCPDGSTKTRQESAQTYATLRRALSDFTLTCDLITTAGDRLAARTSMEGRFTTPFDTPSGSIAPHGKPVHFETISIFRFDSDARLVEEWAQSDNLTLLSQLGASPDHLS